MWRKAVLCVANLYRSQESWEGKTLTKPHLLSYSCQQSLTIVASSLVRARDDRDVDDFFLRVQDVWVGRRCWWSVGGFGVSRV